MAASWHHCVWHCLGGGCAAEHKENIVSMQVYLLLVAAAPDCVNLQFEWKNCFLKCAFWSVCFALYCYIQMYNCCVYLTNHVSGMSV